MLVWAVRSGSRRFLSFHFSTNSAVAHPNADFLVDYLKRSLGISEQEAFQAANKVTPCAHKRNPDLVMGFLKNLGLNNSGIKKIVLQRPSLLFYDVGKTLQPKIQVLQDLGLSRSDIIEVLRCYSSFLRRGLDSEIKPPIQYLRNLLGSDEKVVRAIRGYGCMIHFDVPKRTAVNVEYLQKAGFSKDRIVSIILDNPRFAAMRFTSFQEIMHKVEHDFGISPESKMFSIFVKKFIRTSRSKMDEKSEVLRSFGWSDSMINFMLAKLPTLLGRTNDGLVKRLNFFMRELGYTAQYLASHPMILSFNLEKRVKPRYEVLRAPEEKKLYKTKMHLYSVVSMPESEFVDVFLVPFEAEINDVYESYFSIVGKKC